MSPTQAAAKRTRQGRSAWDLHRETLSLAIERIAITLFDERSFDAVTMEEIAATAGISIRTMFRYFQRKADILVAVQRRRDARLLATILDQPADSTPLQVLHDAFVVTSTIPNDERDMVVARARVLAATRSVGSVTPDAYRNQLDEIVRLIADRMGVDPSTDLRPALLVTTMHNAAALAHERWLAGGAEGDLREVIDATLRIVEQGLESIGGPMTAGQRRRRRS